MTEAIQLYAFANCVTRPKDIGIVLAQTAIERLAHEHVINQEKLLSFIGFDKLSAPERIRLLCGSLKIPIGIPVIYKNLAKVVNAKEHHSGPEAIAKVRNSIVHPEERRRKELAQAHYETWLLSLFYLEAAILRIAGSGLPPHRLP